jgi:hypothetical protein
MSLEQQQDAVSTYVYVVSTFTLPPENGDTINLVAVQYIRVPLLYTTYMYITYITYIVPYMKHSSDTALDITAILRF